MGKVSNNDKNKKEKLETILISIISVLLIFGAVFLSIYMEKKNELNELPYTELLGYISDKKIEKIEMTTGSTKIDVILKGEGEEKDRTKSTIVPSVQAFIELVQEKVDDDYCGVTFPGGHVEYTESFVQSVIREVKEETGLENAYIQQLHTFSAPNRDPRERVITIAYYALVKIQEVKGGDDAASARWFPLDEIPPLAFDHDYILRMATQRLREQIHFQPIGFELLPEKFTIRELQSLYEAILGINFDRRNFAKKMLHLEILTELDETVWRTPKREARLYKFNAEKYEELKRKGFRIEF